MSGIIFMILYIQSIGSRYGNEIFCNLPNHLDLLDYNFIENKSNLFFSPLIFIKNYWNRNNFLNINIIVFLSFIAYKFYLDLNVYGLITLIGSFLISLFIFSRFKFSNNSIISLLQKIAIYTLIFVFNIVLILFIGWYFDLMSIG
jgi:hypothetical protein